MAKRKKKTGRRARQGQDELKAVRTVEYEITFEPIENQRYTRLPDHVKDAISRLHDEAQRHSRQAIPELIALINEYPHVPVLYNLLSVAYARTREIKEMEEVVRQNYQQNPDYLFARLNYAELCIAQGDYKQIAEIFEHKFDLKLLYPDREQFHISEVAGFMGMMGVYFFETGEREVAERYYEALKQIAPRYPMTKSLRNRLHPGILRRLLNRLEGQVQTWSP